MTQKTVQITRTTEIEEASNRYFIHPMSRFFVTIFARLGVHPNLVSVLGMILGFGAALAYFRYDEWPMAVLGFALMIGWHVMDGADGQLARLTGKTSEIGKVLDGLCDHGTFTFVYLSLTFALAEVMGSWVWIPAWLAGISHAIQASTYEFQRQSYDYWVHAKSSAHIVPLEVFQEEVRQKQGVARLFGHMNLFYLKVQYRFAAVDPVLQAQLADAVASDGADAGAIREAYRATQQGGVKTWSILGSNYRTLAIFLAALAGNPLFFLFFELVGLNVALFLLTRMQRRRNHALRRWLDDHTAPRPLTPTNGQPAVARREA